MWHKWLFLLLYIASLAAFCVTVHYWPALSAGCCCHTGHGSVGQRDQRRQQQPASGGAAGAAPLLPGQEEFEVTTGAVPNYPTDRRVIELFEEQVRKAPSAVALIPDSPAAPLSYADLDQAAEEVATELLALGVSIGAVVCLLLERSVAQVVAVYGILKAGAAFVPVDTEAPLQRKCFLAGESDAAVVVGIHGDDSVAEVASRTPWCPHLMLLPADGRLGAITVRRLRTRTASGSGPPQLVREPSEPQSKPVARGRPRAEDMALLVYTSGTTGQPKGIVYDHRHLLHGVYFFGWQCGASAESTALLKSPYIWAIIEWEMFPVLTVGGRLAIASPMGHKSPEYLANAVVLHQVSMLLMTPQVLDLVLDIEESQQGGGAKLLGSLAHIVVVGEPLTSVLANRVVRALPQARLHNFYGASESSCTVYTVPPEGIDTAVFPLKAPVGTPQPHAMVFVMQAAECADGRLHLVRQPPGQRGEICFGGVLAAGYWKHAGLTAEKWVQTEFGLLYRTGDLGRWKAGQLEVVGRTDRQVKVRGVRVEPEEVEAVLRRYMLPVVEGYTELEAGALSSSGSAGGSVRAALKDVAVVASKEPAELVAFVSRRDGIGEVTPEGLRAHCTTDLAPSYVPKFFVVLPELPKLPNGKSNLKELQDIATQHASEEGEVVMDSLGQMKKLSKWAVFENAVIHRCYSFWMLGVLVDHWQRCAIDALDDENNYAPFCTILSRSNVKPWTEVLVRSLGNDQDMFGFIMLGAYQDSRPARPGAPPRVQLGLKDLFVFAVYMVMALPIPQLLHLAFGSWAWPIYWGDPDQTPPKDEWGWDYMRLNSNTSDHRWYLFMVVKARVFMQICEKLRVHGWIQVAIVVAICLIPKSFLEGGEYAFDVCEDWSAETYVLYTFSYIFRNFGDGCAAFWRWEQVYAAFYVLSYHYLRPLVELAQRRTPPFFRTTTCGAMAFSASMLIGLLMALFHYPNNFLENGLGLRWAWLEVGVDIVQPSLLVIGMAHLPLNLAWWGNTTLGAYAFHFYFKDQLGLWTWRMCDVLEWDPTGLLVYFGVVGQALIFTTLFGPLGHYLLISPTVVYSWAKRYAASGRS